MRECERKVTGKYQTARCGRPAVGQNNKGVQLCAKHMPKERQLCQGRSATPAKGGGYMPCVSPAKFFEEGQHWCKRHAPSQQASVLARQKEINDARWRKSDAAWNPGVCKRKWAPVLAKGMQRIADGHNNARVYAAALVKRYNEEMARAEAGESRWEVYHEPEEGLDCDG